MLGQHVLGDGTSARVHREHWVLHEYVRYGVRGEHAFGIGEAAEVIRRGAADVILTGGAEAGICELIGMGGFSTIHAMIHAGLPS